MANFSISPIFTIRRNLMAVIHRISEDLFAESFGLIAMHCSMECYALAYHINNASHISLRRTKNDLEIATAFIPIYEHKSEINGYEWHLVRNSVQDSNTTRGSGLFAFENTFKSHYLLEGRKDIDYVLKLTPNDTNEMNKMLEGIRSIPKVSLAYELDTTDPKTRKNIIF